LSTSAESLFPKICGEKGSFAPVVPVEWISLGEYVDSHVDKKRSTDDDRGQTEHLSPKTAESLCGEVKIPKILAFAKSKTGFPTLRDGL
jgi:hypothetical protein